MYALSKLEWLLLAAVLLLCPGFSWSQAASGATAPPAPAPASLFDRLDRNKDGYLSPEELAGDEAKTRNWIAIDRDRDGRISRAEFGLVAPPAPSASGSGAASAAAGASRPPKQE